jgi:hypothetical protein
LFGIPSAAAVRRDRGAAQTIAQQPIQRAVVVHGDALRSRVVILLVGRAALLVVVAEVRRRRAVERGLDAIAIAIGLKLHSIEETIRDTLAWARTRPADHTWRAGMKIKREAELLRAWNG